MHFIKEVGRNQLLSAQDVLVLDARKLYLASDKTSLLIPVAEAFMQKEIVKVNGNIKN